MTAPVQVTATTGEWIKWRPNRPRIVVDPGSFSRRDPALSVASLEDADSTVTAGYLVWAIQPDDDGTEGIAPGVVVEVNEKYRLLYIRVDWDQLADRLTSRSGA